MEKPGRSTKGKKQKRTTTKKRKCDANAQGPSCSGFLSELSRKWAFKKRQEAEAPRNIVQNIIDSITNALPIKIIKSPLRKKEAPVIMETLQSYAPELISKDTFIVPVILETVQQESPVGMILEEASLGEISPPRGVPRMPVTDSEVLKGPPEKKRKVTTEDIAVNTGAETDVASEIVKHVGTLKKISLIAEEFNQKTAKNLKEIVDSVQEDLMKKLAEIKADQKRMVPDPASKTIMDQEILQKT